jgi:hypothetical protein
LDDYARGVEQLPADFREIASTPAGLGKGVKKVKVILKNICI